MIVIGDEILGGYVTDTNSPFLTRRLQVHGVPCARIQVVADDADDIGEAIHAELARSRPRLIVTSGGIGSTPDDITFEAVAASLDRDLIEDPDIAERLHGIAARTREQGLDAGDDFMWHLLRMARVPRGSRMLKREGSWLPAVAVDVDGGCAQDGGASVVVLPGVPSEFERLVSGVLEPVFLAGRNDVPTVIEVEHELPESALNLTFAAMLAQFPSVKLGSYPGRPMRVRLTGRAEEVEAAARLVRTAITEIETGPAAEKLAAWRRDRSSQQKSRSHQEKQA